MANVLTVPNLPTGTIVNIADSNQGSIQAIAQPGAGSTGGVPLSNVQYVDQQSATAGPEGSIAGPWRTAEDAYAALTVVPQTGVIVFTPYNYTGDSLSNVSTSLTLVGYGAAWSSLDTQNIARMPNVVGTGSTLRIGFQNVRVTGFTDVGGSTGVSIDGCQIDAALIGNAIDNSALVVTNSVFVSGVNLANFALIEMDVPSFLSWQSNGGTISGASPEPTIIGVAAVTIPFYFQGMLTGTTFPGPYGVAAGPEGTVQVLTPQPTRHCRLRLQCTVPLAGAGCIATLRINGADHPSINVLLGIGGTSAEVFEQLFIPAGTLISVSLNGVLADSGAGALWASVDLYP